MEIDCQTVDGIPIYSSGEIATCELGSGMICNNADNFPIPCSDYQVRYRCDCREIPTAFPPDYTGETPTAYPPGYTGETPTAYPPGYTGETPTAYPPGYTGETPTAHPPGYTGETPTAYPPGYTGETPTAYPPGYTGEVPTAYPPGYTGETPTAAPYTCVNGWSRWLNAHTPNGDGEVETLTDQQKQQLCPGGQLVEIDCQTVDGIPIYSSGEIATCELSSGMICNNADNFPIPCSDYQVRYRCECLESPTAFPPGYTGEAPIVYPPGYTGETPTAYPPGYTGEIPTAYPPGYTGEIPTAYPPGYTGEVPTAYPPGYTGEIPTAYPPGYTGETPIVFPPGYTGETPTAYPPGYTGEKPTAYPPGYTGEIPTAHPTGLTCVKGWSHWLNAHTPNGDGEVETLTDQQKQQLCPGGQLVEIDCQTVDGIPIYSSGEIATCELSSGMICNNADNFPIPCSDYQVRYRCDCREIPTAFPPDYTGETPIVYPTGYTGETPTANPPAFTGETPTAFPPGYTGDTPVLSTCIPGWSSWINRDSPSIGDGDIEKMTDSELAAFCSGGGQLVNVECATVDDIPLYSSGEIATCDVRQGLVCNNLDNFPIPCSDYKIRYQCDCSQVTATTAAAATTPATAATTPATTCAPGWSQWMNTDSPNTGDGDMETLTDQQKQQLCLGGQLVEIDCQTVDGIPIYSSGEIATCELSSGMICNNADNFPIPCSDYQVRYRCECGSGPTMVPTSGPSVTPYAPGTSPSNVVTTCSRSFWTAWINKDIPSTGDGDMEFLTDAEKAALCVGGQMSKIDCYTADGIPSYSSGEIMTCDLDGGLVCNNADNFPVPCSDYQVRYFCQCAGRCTLL